MPVTPADYNSKGLTLLQSGQARIDRLGQLRHTEISPKQTGSFAGNLHPTLADSMSQAPQFNPLSLNSGVQITNQLNQMSEVLQMTQMLSGIAAAASVVNIGVSVVGFAIMNKKLNHMQSSINQLADKVDQLPSIIREENKRLFDRLMAENLKEKLTIFDSVREGIEVAAGRELDKRNTLIDPLINDLNRLNSFFRLKFQESLKSSNIQLATQFFYFNNIVISLLMSSYITTQDHSAVIAKKDNWYLELITMRSAINRSLLGNSPGLLNFTKNEKYSNLSIIGFEINDLDPDLALERLKLYQHQNNNSENIIVLRDDRSEIIRPGLVDSRFIQNEFDNNLRVLVEVNSSILPRLGEISTVQDRLKTKMISDEDIFELAS